MRNMLGFDPNDDNAALDGITGELPRVFEMPEDRQPTLSFRPVPSAITAEEGRPAPRSRRTSTRAPRTRPSRVYAVITVLALAFIMVSTAWAVDAARWGGQSSSAAAVAAANQAAAKTTKAKKKSKKHKKSKKKSSKKSSSA